MGTYSDHLKREVRLERMRPAQIDLAKEEQPAVYVPFGSIEWHGIHNPVGLDAIKAHEQLVGLAVRSGGVVYPPVFFGSGGGHLDWPHTFMLDPDPLISIVVQLLWGFERSGYQKAILLSGHYPNRSVYLDAAVKEYSHSGGKMSVLALVENQIPNGLGDHAARYETSFMLFLHPETVDVSLLTEDPSEQIDPDQQVNWMTADFKNHPLYGLVGLDPRRLTSAALGQEMTGKLLDYLASWLQT